MGGRVRAAQRFEPRPVRMEKYSCMCDCVGSVHINVSMRACVPAYVRFLYVCMRLCMCVGVCLHVCMHVCVCAYMAWHGMAWHGMAWHDMDTGGAQNETAQGDMDKCGVQNETAQM